MSSDDKTSSEVRPEDRLSVAALYFSGHEAAITDIDGNVRKLGEWVQLIAPIVPNPAWMPMATADVMVNIETLAGHVVELESVSREVARWNEQAD
jgi:hypothetical protein